MGEKINQSLLEQSDGAAADLVLRAQDAVDLVSSYMEKQYYQDMAGLPIKPLEAMSRMDVADTVWLFQIDKLAYDKNDSNFAEKLETVVSAVSRCGGTLIMLIEANAGNVSFHIGVADKYGTTNLLTVKDTLRNSITGNFPGSSMSELDVDVITDKLAECFGDGFCNNCVTAVSSISGQGGAGDYYRGVESILHSSFDAPFSLLILADPVDRNRLQDTRNAYEDISTQLSKLMNVQVSLQQGTNSGVQDSVSDSTNKQVSVGKSVSSSESRSHTVSSGSTKRQNPKSDSGAMDILVGAGAVLSTLSGQPAGLYALNTIRGLFNDQPEYWEDTNTGESDTTGSQTGTSDSVNTSHSQGRQVGHSTNFSASQGYSAGYNVVNRAAKRLYDEIEEYLGWIGDAANFGMFQVCAYVLSASAGTNMVIASQYEAMLHGTGIGNTYGVNTWTDDKGAQIRQYLSHFQHPVMLHERLGEVDPSILVSSREMARHLVFPQKSMAGLSIVHYEPLGRNVINRQTAGIHGDIRVGCINYMGNDIPQAPVPLSIDSLSAHTFVSGANSTGKSTAVFSLLHKIHKRKIPFLVIEPAKGEYKKKFRGLEGVTAFSPMLNDEEALPFRINLFWFRESIDPNEHIQKLTEIFNACWPMYAAMPQVLFDAMCRAYEECGWDLERAVNPYGRVFPNVRDVCRQVKTVINQSDFSAEVRGNYIGSLLTRLESLDRGIYKRIFSSGDLGDEQLFEKSTIIDISRPDASEVKALIMGLLIVRHLEYCTSSADMPDERPLRHLTVLEEAHNLLAAQRPGSAEGADMGAKAVEMMSRCIAELGGFGHGFVIADQAPGLLDRSVIRNTNTKMVFRLPDMGDCELCGRSISLRPEQYTELSRLERGVCAIHQINWEEAVLCHVSPDPPTPGEHRSAPPEAARNSPTVRDYLRCLLLPFSVISPTKPVPSPGEMEAAVAWAAECGLSAQRRMEMIKAVTGAKPNWSSVVKVACQLVDRRPVFSAAGSRDDVSLWTERGVEAVREYADDRRIALTLIEALLEDMMRAGEDREYFHDTWFDAVKAQRIPEKN